jgi:hypothetical protein
MAEGRALRKNILRLPVLFQAFPWLVGWVSDTARYVTGTILDCDSGSQPGDARDRQSAHNTKCRLKYEVKPTTYG